MADIQHGSITDPYLHEPKGASTAGANTVYVANGSGTGVWKVLAVESLDYADLKGDLQTELDAGTIAINGTYYLTARLADISTPSSVILPVLKNSTVVRASLVLGGAITVADAVVNVKNSAGAAMGTPITVPFTGSAKGNQFAFTATGSNVLTGPTWIEVETNGASDTVQPAYVTVELRAKLN